MSSPSAQPPDLEISPFDQDDPEYLTHDTPRDRRVCADPMPISAAAGRWFMQGVHDPATGTHPTDGACKVCEKPLPDVLWRQIHAELAPGWFPITCCDPCYEAAKIDQERLRRNRELWASLCPTDFRPDWDNSKGDPKLLKRVMDWAAKWDTKGRKQPKKGLVIHGDSSTAKTRACWHLYRRLCEEGVGVLMVDAFDLVEETPKEAFTVDCLIIDDLGNDAMDFRKEQRLLRLFRVRAQWHRPFVVTTQFTGSDLVARFKQEATGEAVVRRLRDFCDDIHAHRVPVPPVRERAA